MPKIILDVPYPDKEEAKLHGARWDNNLKKWYIFAPYLKKEAQKWLPHKQANIIAEAFYILNFKTNCWSCKKEILVHGILLDTPFQSREYDYDDSINIIYHKRKRAYASYITYIDENSLNIIKANNSGNWRFDFSKTTKSNYLMNHCFFCDAKLGDFFLSYDNSLSELYLPVRKPDSVSIVGLRRYDNIIYLACDYSKNERFNLDLFL